MKRVLLVLLGTVLSCLLKLCFSKEIDELESAGIDVASRLKIAEACPLILPYHIALDQAREIAKGASKIVTTGRGIGPAYEDKVARRLIRVIDLFDKARFESKLKENLEYYNFQLTEYFKVAPVNFKDVYEQTLLLAERIKPWWPMFRALCMR